ncbi:phytoene desaturase family protein [Azospirillum brasilense]|nr:NAD(P)/FAD-dependent oxidoreductase [Azospirillum brasilense]
MPTFGGWPAGDHEHHAVVVGAGIGGLSAAATLAARGLKVLVVEAHDRPGGYCSSWLRKVRGRDGSVGRYVFDAGVQDFSGLGPRGPLRRLLDGLGVAQRMDWRRVRHRYVQDGLCLDVPDQPADLVTRLQALFPQEAPGIAAFFAEMGRVYADLYADVDETGGVPMPPATLEEMRSWTARRPDAWRWMHRPYAEMLDAHLRDPRLKDLLTTISEYVTDRPELLPVREMAPLFGYYLEGGWYPAGGSQRLAELLCAVVRERGGAVHLRTRAERILIEDGRAVGIATGDGTVHRAPLVLANSDVVGTLTRLVDPALLPRRYAQRVKGLKRGPTAVLVSLAVEGVPDLPARVFVGADGLHFGIGNPSAVDPSLAPRATPPSPCSACGPNQRPPNGSPPERPPTASARKPSPTVWSPRRRACFPGCGSASSTARRPARRPSPATRSPTMAPSTAPPAVNGARRTRRRCRGSCWSAPAAKAVPASRRW